MEKLRLAHEEFATEDSIILKRYSRIARRAEPAEQPSDDQIAALALAIKGVGSNRPDTKSLAAAYTYFGQFLAHDITNLYRVEGKYIFSNKETSSLDLSGLWKNGAQHFNLPNLQYVNGNTGLGLTAGIGEYKSDYDDLARNASGEPVVPDERNDSNLALAQMHVALSKYFYYVRGKNPGRHVKQDVEETCRHIQEIVLFDFLEQIVDTTVYSEVLDKGRGMILPEGITPGDDYFTPIEFAVACGRYGHTMVRSHYRWNSKNHARPDELLANTKIGGELDTGRYLRADWVPDWKTMAPVEGATDFERAVVIGPALPSHFKKLPGSLFQNLDPDKFYNLAYKTMERGLQLSVPPAQCVHGEVVKRLLPNHTPPPLMEPSQICSGCDANLRSILMAGAAGHRLVDRTPLWFYILQEAIFYYDGNRLGPLAGRVVMETFHAAIEASGTGLIKNNAITTKKPQGGYDRSFDGTLSDLLNIAQKWKKP